MKITFLGTSHGIAERDRCCSCTVITVNGKHYLIDAGAPIYDLLQRYNFRFEDIGGIFITHTHSDHNIGLVALYDALNSFNKFSHVKIKAYTPDEVFYNNIKAFLGFLPDHKRLEFIKYNNGLCFDDGNIKVTSIPTAHIEGSHAFIIEAEGKKIGFSGDLHRDLFDYPKEFTNANDKLELVVMEGAHQFYKDEYVYNVLKNTNTKKMLINHICSGRNNPEIMQAFKQKIKDSFDVDVAYDGLTLQI